MAKKTISPADCDRWDTPPGVIKETGPKNTPAQQKLVNQINTQRAAEKKKKTAKR